MSWYAIARRDFRGVRRAKLLWGATAIFVFFYGLLLLPFSAGDQPSSEAAADAVTILVFPGGFLLPLVVVSMGYLSIAGERSRGSIKYLLGLPNSRKEVIVGKYLSRAAVASIAVGIAAVVGAFILLLKFGTVPSEYLIYVAMTLLLALAFMALTVGVSAFSATRGKAMAGSIGLYFVLGILWVIPTVNPQESVAYLIEDLLGMDAIPELYEFVYRISPVHAYATALQGFVMSEPDRNPDPNSFHPASSETPVYLTDDFMIVVLLAWIVVPLAIGYWRFNRAELG